MSDFKTDFRYEKLCTARLMKLNGKCGKGESNSLLKQQLLPDLSIQKQLYRFRLLPFIAYFKLNLMLRLFNFLILVFVL